MHSVRLTIYETAQRLAPDVQDRVRVMMIANALIGAAQAGIIKAERVAPELLFTGLAVIGSRPRATPKIEEKAFRTNSPVDYTDACKWFAGEYGAVPDKALEDLPLDARAIVTGAYKVVTARGNGNAKLSELLGLLVRIAIPYLPSKYRKGTGEANKAAIAEAIGRTLTGANGEVRRGYSSSSVEALLSTAEKASGDLLAKSKME